MIKRPFKSDKQNAWKVIQTLTIINFFDVQIYLHCTEQWDIIGFFYATDYYTERKFDNLSVPLYYDKCPSVDHLRFNDTLSVSSELRFQNGLWEKRPHCCLKTVTMSGE